jgi:hypothetical protein
MHSYIYPTSAVKYNTVYSGDTSVQASRYNVARWQVNPSVHIGWELGFQALRTRSPFCRSAGSA